jgi:hypothetical protein
MRDAVIPDLYVRFRNMWLDPRVSRGEIAATFHISRATVTRTAARLGLPAKEAHRRGVRHPAYERQEPAECDWITPGRSRPARELHDALPPAHFLAVPARPRPCDRPGEVWVQLR